MFRSADLRALKSCHRGNGPGVIIDTARLSWTSTGAQVLIGRNVQCPENKGLFNLPSFRMDLHLD